MPLSWFILKSLSDVFSAIQCQFLWHFPPLKIAHVPVHDIWWLFFWTIILMDLLFAFTCQWNAWHIPSYILSLPFVTYQHLSIVLIQLLSTSKKFSFYYSPSEKWAGSSPYITIPLSRKPSNIFASNSISLYLDFVFQSISKLFFMLSIRTCFALHSQITVTFVPSGNDISLNLWQLFMYSHC